MPLALLLLLAVAAPLDEDAAFQDGLAAFRELRLEEAAVAFQRAALDDSRPAHERARVQMWLGATYGQLGDLNRARSAFAFAFALSPDAMLPVRVSPKVVSILEEERKKARDKRELALTEKVRVEAEAAARAAAERERASAASSPAASPAPVEKPPSAAARVRAAGAGPKKPAARGDEATKGNDDEGPGLLNSWTTTGVVVGGLGALLAIGGVTLGLQSYWLWNEAQHPETRQAQAVEYKLLADGSAGGAYVMGGAGVALVAAGVTCVFIGVSE